MKGERENAEQKAHNWRKELKFDPKFDTFPDKFFAVISDFESLWDFHLGQTDVAKHFIK